MPKVKLSQTYLYRGKHYGPGEVEIEDAEVAKALQERDAGILAARRPQAEARPATPTADTAASTRKGR